MKNANNGYLVSYKKNDYYSYRSKVYPFTNWVSATKWDINNVNRKFLFIRRPYETIILLDGEISNSLACFSDLMISNL